jgi:hypothetical protein
MTNNRREQKCISCLRLCSGRLHGNERSRAQESTMSVTSDVETGCKAIFSRSEIKGSYGFVRERLAHHESIGELNRGIERILTYGRDHLRQSLLPAGCTFIAKGTTSSSP